MGGMNHVRVEESQLNTPYPERVYTPPPDDDPYHVRTPREGSRTLLIGAIMGAVALAAAGAAWNTYGFAGPPVTITADGDYKTAAPAPVVAAADTNEVYRVMEGASVTAASAPGRPLAPSAIDLHPGGGAAPSPVVTPSVLAAPAAIAPSPASSASGGYLAQIAAVRSEDAARTAWKETSARNPSLMLGARMDIQRADLGSQGVFFRLRAGYFGDRDQAGAFCDRLKAAGLACMVVSQ